MRKWERRRWRITFCCIPSQWRYLYALCALPLMLAQLPMKCRGHGVLLGISAAWLVLWVFGYTIAVEVL